MPLTQTVSLSLGKQAEGEVCFYLRKRGYQILRRNYRCPFGEIDIIAQKGNTISFVEVKARAKADFVLPCEYVTSQKQAKIKKTALFFINGEKGLQGINFSFDVASVTKTHRGALLIDFIEGAFE